jgi:predicted AAA+ superfamily ATPase
LSFREFLAAEGSASVESYIFSRADPQPVDDAFHRLLLDKLRTYLLIGGMPAVVASYVASRDIRRCQELLDALLQTLWTDFAKYSNACPVTTLRDAFWSVARQAGGKFVYSHVSPECSRHMAKKATDLLAQANLVHQVFHSSARGIPLGAQTDRRRLKALPFDLGLHQRMLGLDLTAQLLASGADLVNRGNLAEAFVGLELIAGSSRLLRPQLYYWHREEPGSNAEVDYVIQRDEQVIPIEVKSGTRGSMQSLRWFMSERKSPLGLRLSHENVGRYGSILALPLYLACLVPERLRLLV